MRLQEPSITLAQGRPEIAPQIVQRFVVEQPARRLVVQADPCQQLA
jgi:hypothetical protein